MAHKVSEPSICLVTHAQQHLAFLQEVDSIAAILKKPNVIAKVVHRYENCWLPLLAAHRDEELLPPLDVHWAWHVHMLSPRQYAADVTKIVGRLIDHKFHPLKEDEPSALSRTSKLWCSMFPDEPYEIDFGKIPLDFSFPGMIKIAYDIQAASYRQLEFYYNVSLPHFGSVPFLEEAKYHYLMFIYLISQNKGAFLVPMYDIDLMWHTHQLSPAAYDKDCKSWLGYVLNHDDTTTDRSPGSHLSNSQANTRELWGKSFKEVYAIPGVGYRGPDHREKLHAISNQEIIAYQSRTVQIRLDSVNYVHYKRTKKLKGSLKVLVHTENDREIIDRKLPMISEEPFTWSNDLPSGLLVFNMVHLVLLRLDVYLKSYKGSCSPLYNGSKVFNSEVDVTREVKAAVDKGYTTFMVSGQFGLMEDEDVQSSVQLSFTVADSKINHYAEFKLGTSIWQPFKPAIIWVNNDDRFELGEGFFRRRSDPTWNPELNETIWGAVHLPRDLTDSDTWDTGNHSLEPVNGSITVNKNITVRIVHSLSLEMSVVQILHKEKLTAISHLIGQEQLPSSNQAPSDAHKWMTLDLQKGERAMLIKNHSGDWAIIKAIWDRRSKDMPGHLQVHVKLLKRNQDETFKVLEDEMHGSMGCSLKETFDFMGSEVNLATDKLKIKCHENEMVEHIATIFSALVLYTLCEPRRGDKPKADRKTNAANVKWRRKHPGNYNLMLAAGYVQDTPSNSYLWWKWYLACEYSCDCRSKKRKKRCAYHDDGEKPIICPWDPDGKGKTSDLVSKFVRDTKSGAGSCGSCVNGIKWPPIYAGGIRTYGGWGGGGCGGCGGGGCGGC